MTESGRPELLNIEHFDGRPSSTQLCRQKNKPQILSDLRLVENESAGVGTLDLRIKSAAGLFGRCLIIVRLPAIVS
jgi:hypothetical protein